MRWVGCTIESLEDRRMLSASVVKDVAREGGAVHAVHAKPQAAKKKVHAAVTTPAAAVAWNDLVGTWTGTFTVNGSTTSNGSISATFQPRWIASNTGTFNLSGMAGQSGALTTITPDHAGNVLAYIPLKNGGAVCLAAGLSYNGKVISGRWGTIIGTKYTMGTFTMTRP